MEPPNLDIFTRKKKVGMEEKTRLNQLGGEMLRKAGLVFEEWKDYYWITKETGDVGYADYYLVRFWNDTKKINEADASVYRKLVDIDSKLGTEYSWQLFCCLSWTTRWDIIKVRFNDSNISFEIILDYRF